MTVSAVNLRGTERSTQRNITYRSGLVLPLVPLQRQPLALVVAPSAGERTQHNASADSVGRGEEPAPAAVVLEARRRYASATPPLNPPAFLVARHPCPGQPAILAEGHDVAHAADSTAVAA